jgi:hypothetical protein
VSGRKYPIRRVDPPPVLKLHYDDLSESQRGWWEQIPTVTPATAIEQGVRTGVRPDLITQAIIQARGRGMVNTAMADRLAADLERRYA